MKSHYSHVLHWIFTCGELFEESREILDELWEQGWPVVRALAFHHCAHVPDSIPRPDVILGLALFGLYFVPRGFFPGSSVFPSHQKTTFEFVKVFCRDLIFNLCTTHKLFSVKHHRVKNKGYYYIIIIR